ncbi:hypothetical protein J6590_058499 [Homalodisca vitripennis]|nr:hypothetical protein J6590_058499 [Homalodisca vitripennis]
MNKLNDLSKANSELTQERDSSLSSAKRRCMGLNNSFKCKFVQCCELEDRYEAVISRLNAQLSKCREEKLRLQESASKNVNVDTERVFLESHEKLAALTAERQVLLTTVEVLEADLRCLRGEHDRDGTPALTLSLTSCSRLLLHDVRPVSDTYRPASPQSAGPQDSFSFKDVLLIGDSHLRYAGRQCVSSGAYWGLSPEICRQAVCI